MDKIDFNTHEEYSLGDTHLTYDQIADAAGLTRDRVRKDKRLAEVPRVQIAGRRGAPLALEYTGVVHAYIQYPPHVREYTYHQPDRRAGLIKALKRLWKRMPLKKAAELMGVNLQLARAWMLKHGIRAPVDWSRRLQHEAAYARQCKAQDLHEQGSSRPDIARVLGVSKETVRTYLRGVHERPRPIEGRSPIGEQDHDLW